MNAKQIHTARSSLKPMTHEKTAQKSDLFVETDYTLPFPTTRRYLRGGGVRRGVTDHGNSPLLAPTGPKLKIITFVRG